MLDLAPARGDREPKGARMIEGNDESTRRIVTIYDDIYDRPDARAYYRAMDAAGFRTAHHAADGFAAALSAVRARRGGGACKILDFASGSRGSTRPPRRR
jgi:hypothetical protein